MQAHGLEKIAVPFDGRFCCRVSWDRELGATGLDIQISKNQGGRAIRLTWLNISSYILKELNQPWERSAIPAYISFTRVTRVVVHKTETRDPQY